MRKSIFQFILLGSVIGLVTLGLFEIALRMMPSILPAPILVRFNEEIRQEIAADQGFMIEDLTYVLDRDDGGPELRIPNPGLMVSYPEIFAFDTDVGVKLSVQMDEIGFCNPAGHYTQSERFDIVTIGDSLTWCHTVDVGDTFSYQLQSKVEQSVLNLGKGGVGLYEYIQILKGFGVEKRPEIVFLNVYEGNDLRDAVEYWNARDAVEPGETEQEAGLISIRDSIRNSALGRRSYAINTLIAVTSYAYSYFAYPEERIAGSIDFGYQVSLMDEEVAFNAKNLDVDEIVYAMQLSDGEISLEVFTNALQEFVVLSRQYGFKPIVTYIPSAHTAYRSMLTFRDPDLNLLLDDYNQSMTDYFSTSANYIGFDFIDLTPVMQNEAENSSLDQLMYFPTNLHLTPHGHRVIADRLSQEFSN